MLKSSIAHVPENVGGNMANSEFIGGAKMRCMYCGGKLSPAGGIVGIGTLYYACWDCGYRVDVVHDAEVVDAPQIGLKFAIHPPTPQGQNVEDNTSPVA